MIQCGYLQCAKLFACVEGLDIGMQSQRIIAIRRALLRALKPQRNTPSDMAPSSSALRIEFASQADVGDVIAMIRELAEYEKLSHLCVSTEVDLSRALFGSPARAEVIIGKQSDESVCFALFFHNFSTFLGRPGLYLEDLFVRPPHRRKGYGRAMLIHLAALAELRGCGRFEWSVLDWNESAIRFYESLGATVLPDWRIVRVTGTALTQLAATTQQGAAR